ncbi:diacylglycerol kinase [Hazenella sp. IB182357]|uniref:Diacylglycerol kinase n=1 Tax=Polycladospora coralii TaxID=2771432 RepID=A0A926RS94_9BACL|nr:diacylglycerol kinase [Polycladospora coralii]MBD1370770.1 diacylglycerol kinase [Polycladospora coralii]MBS7529708.1 diacylglycerol kinase [Polycladospora coralii]
MKRARLIYNPTSGREVIEKELSKLLSCLESAGYEASCAATKQAGDARMEAMAAAERHFDIVIAGGGDGTIHEVVNGLACHPHRPKLGILPGGTTNDFARGLKLPKDLTEACAVIARGKTQAIDVGKYRDRYFINVAAAGKITEITYEAPSRLKTMVGPLAYYAKAMEKIGTLHKPFVVRVEADHKTLEQEILLMVVANSVSVGGFEKLAPTADLSDGLLDVLILPKLHIPDLLQLAALAYRGEHIHDSRLIYFQTSQLKVDTPEPFKLNLDGEWGGELPGTFELLPRHLEVFCP